MVVETGIIDTDTHFTEPADLWSSRLPASWGDRVMRVQYDDTLGADVWVLGNRVVAKAWTGAMYGWDEPYPSAPRTLADVHPAAYDLGERLVLMDEVGIRAAVLYPNIAGLFMDPFVDNPDREAALAHVRAYNDHLVESVASMRDRFIPMAVIPYWDIEAAVAEVERVADRGVGGIVTTGAPHLHEQPYLGDRHWDPLWQVCVQAGMSVSFHAANGDMSAHLAPARLAVDGPAVTVARASTAAFLDNGQQLTDLLLCGVLARFPDLKFVSVESGLGWVGFVLESCDYHFKKSRVDREKPEFGSLLPSELFHRQVYVNYWFEQLQPWHVEAVGEDNILFETDFPHPTCITGDEVRTSVDRGLADIDTSIRDKILYGNAAALYRITRSSSGPS